MKLYINTAQKYIKYYLNRSLCIGMSMVLSIALIVGIGTLSQSAKQADVEQMKYENGNYHVRYADINKEKSDIISQNKKNFLVGFTQYYDSDANARINLIRADRDYIKLCNSELIKGRIPNKEGEIALEPWVLSNLHMSDKLGQQITFNLYKKKIKETYTLVGILEDRVDTKTQGIIEGILSIKGVQDGEFDAYVQFPDEINIPSAITQLQKQCHIRNDKVSRNSPLLESMGATEAVDANLLMMNIIIALFAGMVIYSIFNISILQRTSEYGMLKAIGAKSNQIFKFIFSELALLFLSSIPIGIILGLLGAKVFSSFVGQLFTEGEVSITKIFLSKKATLFSVELIFIIILIIAMMLSLKLKNISPVDAMTKNFSDKYLRKIMNINLLTKLLSQTQVISLKNMMRNKRAFFTTIVTMALGGVIFIVANFGSILEINSAELNLKVNTGLNSDFKIESGMNDAKAAVSKNHIKQIQNLSGVKSIDPIQVKYGGILINAKKVVFPQFFDYQNNNGYTKNVLNGIFTKETNSNNYLLKSCIYGYNERLIKNLAPYLLEGKIDIDKMEKEDIVLFHMPLAYPNNYEFNLKTGDKIKVKFLEDTKMTSENIKMPENLKYIEKEFTIGGIVSNITNTTDYYANDGGEIILSQNRFEKIMGYSNYSLVNVDKEKNANHAKINKEIFEIVSDVPGAVIRDMVNEIEGTTSYINQKTSFIYAITLILFIIGLFNIMNNISYSLVSRISEFSIIRAIGLDNKGFQKMILFEGLVYGTLSGFLTLIGSLMGQIILFNIVKNSYISPKFSINYKLYILIILINLLIGFIATYLPSRKIKNMSIVQSINNKE